MEKDVGSLDGVHVLARHLELVKVEVFREHFHSLSPFFDKFNNLFIIKYIKSLIEKQLNEK